MCIWRGYKEDGFIIFYNMYITYREGDDAGVQRISDEKAGNVVSHGRPCPVKVQIDLPEGAVV